MPVRQRGVGSVMKAPCYARAPSEKETEHLLRFLLFSIHIIIVSRQRTPRAPLLSARARYGEVRDIIIRTEHHHHQASL